MKLKNKYVLRTVADKTVAIAVENAGEQTEGVITLNETGAFIFSKLNEGMEEAEICESFFDEYDVTKEEAKKAIDSFMDHLKASNLLED